MGPDNEPLMNDDCRHHDQAVVNGGANIVHYQRRTGEHIQMQGIEQSKEVLFIDDHTPTPPLPLPPRHIPFDRRRRDDENVLYIGPE